ncbi:MAG: MaoC/PaaZ C-terminal domain-containing protein [Thermoprotei archaeon]
MHFEDFKLNEVFSTKGRTITETDVVVFSTLTGAFNSLFLNEDYARKSRFGSRIVPGYLTASIATGLVYQLSNSPFENGFIALLSSSFKALKSVKIGDTIYCDTVVKSKEEREKTGVVTLESSVKNQVGEKVLEITHTILVEKRSAT